jgi:peptide/nickel transport system substrate-binding protein
MAKKLSGLRLSFIALALGAVGGALWWAARPDLPTQPASQGRGGSLVATVRSEPRSFNRLVARDRTSNLVSLLLHDKLVHINLATQQAEPGLAESWTASADGRIWTIALRNGVSFSDGTPFTAADVLFSLEAVSDARTGSVLAGSLQVGGRPLTATATDERTVVLTFPATFGPGVRILDNLPILPAHKLKAALAEGTLREVWGLTTPPSDLVGLGPFMLKEYRPGERLVFERNPHYWRRDEAGRSLPRLDTLTLLVVPDAGAELLRLQAGEADITSGDVPPEDLASVQRAVSQGKLQLFDVGVGLDADFLWFNLKAGAVPRGRAWLQSRELRQAIAAAVDRRAFADTVYLGAAVPIAGPVTSGNREWHDPSLPLPAFDTARARQLLAAAGLADRDGDGQLEAPDGSAARFALLTQKGHGPRERGAAFIQQDLARIGLGVDVVTLETPALIDRVTTGSYEAAYFGTQASYTDPSTNLDFWLSAGAFHAWNPGQSTPATPWELEIDQLMQRQVATTYPAERKRLFALVQQIFAEEVPAIYFVAPRVSVAAGARVTGVQPGTLQPYILWNAAMIGVETRP